jgi:hypothetical protein
MPIEQMPLKIKPTLGGELYRRLHLNFDRLERNEYSVEAVVNRDYTQDQWPGDYVGRVVLALSSLALATRREPKYLREIIRRLPDQFNTKGYLGQIQPSGYIDEQQLSGHGWLISGLCRYAEWSGESEVLSWVQTIIKNLGLSQRRRYLCYPRVPDQRNETGRESGNRIDKAINGWLCSTDIGCAYIFLEGLVCAYQYFPSPELELLIDEVGETFLSLNLLEISAQTHATLTASRNLLKYIQMNPRRASWHEKIEGIYELYRREAMTENYANYNWFTRPETWTEPCAVVDSLILAFELWQATGKVAYLDDVHHIYFNAICYGQKTHGGFGCDTCSGFKNEYITASCWDVTWCCNMRGACGLSAALNSIASIEDATLRLDFYTEAIVTTLEFTLQESTGYPYDGWVRLQIDRKNPVEGETKVLKMFVPSEIPTDSIRVRIDGRDTAFKFCDNFVTAVLPEIASLTVELTFELPLITAPLHNSHSLPGYHVIKHGILVLGTDSESLIPSLSKNDLEKIGPAQYRVKENSIILKPLSVLTFSNATADQPGKKQILFKD